MSSEKLKEVNKYCRLCGRTNAVINVLGVENMPDLVEKYYNIKIEKEDKFPKMICEACGNEILKIQQRENEAQEKTNEARMLVERVESRTRSMQLKAKNAQFIFALNFGMQNETKVFKSRQEESNKYGHSSGIQLNSRSNRSRSRSPLRERSSRSTSSASSSSLSILPASPKYPHTPSPELLSSSSQTPPMSSAISTPPHSLMSPSMLPPKPLTPGHQPERSQRYLRLRNNTLYVKCLKKSLKWKR